LRSGSDAIWPCSWRIWHSSKNRWSFRSAMMVGLGLRRRRRRRQVLHRQLLRRQLLHRRFAFVPPQVFVSKVRWESQIGSAGREKSAAPLFSRWTRLFRKSKPQDLWRRRRLPPLNFSTVSFFAAGNEWHPSL
jgi:hypothetical protein